ncbi:MAG: hypothetical protein ACYCOU_21005 [Sulfobacillus sp.]
MSQLRTLNDIDPDFAEGAFAKPPSSRPEFESELGDLVLLLNHCSHNQNRRFGFLEVSDERCLEICRGRDSGAVKAALGMYVRGQVKSVQFLDGEYSLVARNIWSIYCGGTVAPVILEEKKSFFFVLLAMKERLDAECPGWREKLRAWERMNDKEEEGYRRLLAELRK